MLLVVEPPPPPPKPPTPSGLQVTVAFQGGSYGVGGLSDNAMGVAIQAGRRYGKLLLFGEYDPMSLGGDDLQEGRLHRLGGNARLDVLDFGHSFKPGVWAGGLVWLEAGLGWESFSAGSGTRFHRGDGAFGVGAQYTLKFGEAKPRMLGIFYEARFLLADAPARSTVAALCVDGCTGQAASPRDLGVFFVAGLTFAR